MDNWYTGKFHVGGKARRSDTVRCVLRGKGKLRGEERGPSPGKRETLRKINEIFYRDTHRPDTVRCASD